MRAVAHRTDAQRRHHTAYERMRARALRAGTWQPRRVAEAVREPTELDLAWVAGYLEGEGSFGRVSSPTCQSMRIRADSTDREPIVRLLELFGGGFSDGVTITKTGKPMYRWSTSGTRSVRIAAAIVDQLSPRRQAQIAAALPKGVHRAAT